MSRTRKFVQGLAANYALVAVMAVCGLWLTRFLLARVGQEQYGNWLVLIQMLGYLDLIDLGVVAVLPREVAYATGQSAPDQRVNAVADVVRRAWRVTWLQAPVACAAAALFWWLAGGSVEELAWPAALVALVYVVLFPARVFPAALLGMQDLAFVSGIHFATWLVQFGVTVALVVAGYGAWALVLGWVAQRLANALLSWLRYRSLTRGAAAAGPADPDARGLLRSGLWVSVGRLAQGLLSGTEIIILGKVLGPDPVVVYTCTAKLIATFSPHLYGIVTTAEPGISELRRGGERGRLVEVSRSLGLLMLLASGLVGVVVLATNEGFVRWWVGEGRYAGNLVNVLLVATMLVRHFMFTLTHLLFCFGYERALAIVNLTDGAVLVGATAGLVGWLGVLGAPLGSLLAVLTVSLPSCLVLLSREMGVTPLALALAQFAWVWRFVLVSVPVALLAVYYPPAGLAWLTVAASAAVAAYAVVMLPLLFRPPLRSYVLPRWAALRDALLRRRPAGVGQTNGAD